MICTLLRLLALAGPMGGDGAATDDPPWSPCVARVVDGATHVAVPGVDVWWLDPEDLSVEDAFTVNDRGLVPEEWIRRLGRHEKSDSAGDVALPFRHGERVVVAWHEGKFARHDENRSIDNSRIIALELEPDVGQKVRVVDRAGAPLADIEVAAWCEEHGICGNCGPNDDHIWMASTDAHGETVVPHAQWFFSHQDTGGNLGRRAHLVGLGFPTRDRKRAGRETPGHDSPAIVLVAPQLEPLAFDLELESGELCTSPTPVALAPGEPSRDPFFSTGRPFGSWLARDGRVALPHVERGLAWTVSSAWDRATGSFWHEVAISQANATNPSSPRSARANRHFVRFRGRAIDGEGRPIGGREVGGMTFLSGGSATDPSDMSWFDDFVRTDDDGRFVFEFDSAGLWDRDRAKARTLLFLGMRCAGERYSHSETGIARVAVPEDDGLRLIDVGDVILPPPRVSIAGRVVDHSGTPMPGATLRILKRAAKSADDDSESIVTDGDGRFEYWKESFNQPLAVEGNESGWHVAALRVQSGGSLEPPATPIAVGSNDVDIVLAQYGGARGRIVLPAGSAASDFEVVAIQVTKSTLRPFPTPEDPLVGHVDLYPDGVFELRGPPHDVAVEVRCRGTDRALATSPAIALPERGLVEFPELVIDLAAKSKKK